jgi:PTH1 family peptidyl-tRNA hydrolase
VNLIVGLGNPGQPYRHTRHNIGFLVISFWSRKLGVRLTSRRFQSRSTLTGFRRKKIILLRPMTFMNRSGGAVNACASAHGISVDDILVIHDDLDLPLGRIKVARSGGAGGHKGVRSLIDHLGSTQFSRIKIGIGRPRYGEDIEDFVLSPFYGDEQSTVKRTISAAVHACELFVSEGIETAMTRINCLNLAHKEVTS